MLVSNFNLVKWAYVFSYVLSHNMTEQKYFFKFVYLVYVDLNPYYLSVKKIKKGL